MEKEKVVMQKTVRGAKPWSVLVALAMVLSLLTFGIFNMPMAAADEIDEATGQETENSDPAGSPEVAQSGEEAPSANETLSESLGSAVKSLIQPRIGGWGPVTGPAAAGWAANTGESTWIDAGYQMANFTGTGETLQQFAPFRVGGPSASREWCVDLEAFPPVGAGELVDLPLQKFAGIPATYQVDDATQMAYILRAYGESDDVLTTSAVAVLVHLNYDVSSSATVLSNLVATLEADPVQIAAKAREIVAAAKANAAEYFTGGEVVVAPNMQDFTVTDIGVQQMPAGNYLGGFDVTVRITSGNGAFEQAKVPNGTVSADGLVWTGKTVEGSAVTLGGHSTANGKIDGVAQYKAVPLAQVQGFQRPNNSQTTIGLDYGYFDPKVETEPEEIVRDFQPVLVSSTESAGSKVVAPGTTTLKDELTVSTDSSYAQTEWLGMGRTFPGQDEYKPLPVQFKGTAYFVGEEPVGTPAGTVPAGAVKVAETTIVATDGPGVYTAEADYSGKPGFITWVWELDKTDQPHIVADELYMIHGDWADSFGLATEQTSVQHPGKIESNIKIHPTNDNTYLVDDVWVSGLPKNHPTFAGAAGFGADAKEITQSLVFWPGLSMDEVTSLEGSQEIASVEIPAKNGFYPSVGDLEFKLQRDANGDLLVGTYQFVHSFVGDDRVVAFQSIIPDVNEMYEVPAEPKISTTAMGEVDDMVGAFEDVTITDTVCYLNLKPGKEYELSGTLKDQATGEDLLVDGKPVTASKKFTPTAKEGCEDLEFTFNASALAGTTTVVFEDLYQDGVVVATHSDIEDEGQTVYIPEVKTTAVGEADKMVGAFEDVTITDTACYTGLKAGKEYTIEGILMDQATGKPLMADGKQVTGSTTFTADKRDGCVDIEFKFNASALAGSTVVVFEDVYAGDTKVASHADLKDEGQTVYIPEVKTTATGPDGGKVIEKAKDQKITDKVCYSKLVPGKEYTLEGILMDKTTTKPLEIGGKQVTSTAKFTPTKADGCTEMVFTFDASGLKAGQALVVFEDLYQGDVKIGVHADITDEGQTVKVKGDRLPETGAAGTVAMAVIGLGLVGGGLALVLRRKSSGEVA